MSRSIAIQSTVTAVALAFAAWRWQAIGAEGQSWVFELFLVKGPHTLAVAGAATALVIVFGLVLALLMLRGGLIRQLLVPVLAVLNAVPIAMALGLLVKERLAPHPYAGAITLLTATNLLIYYYALHYFQELAAEIKKPYLVAYRFEGAPIGHILSEKICWLVLSSCKPVFFLMAGFSLFTDHYFAASASGAIGSLFSFLSRDALLSSRIFLFLMTAVFFSAIFFCFDALVMGPVERSLRGRAAAGLLDRAWLRLFALLQRLRRRADGDVGSADWWLAPPQREAARRRAAGSHALVAVFLLIAAGLLLASLPGRHTKRLVELAAEGSEGMRPSPAAFEGVLREVERRGLPKPDVAAPGRDEGFALGASGDLDTAFLLGAESFLEQLQSFADQQFGGVWGFLNRIGPVALGTVLAAYLLAILVAYRQQYWVVWLPSVLEAFPFMIWLLFFDQLAIEVGDRSLWYVGLGVIALPICYQQSLRLLNELTDRNIIFGERMMAVSDVRILWRLTRFRGLPLLLGQTAFVCGLALLVDASMNFLRYFSARTTLPALVGELWRRALNERVDGHPLVEVAYRGIQWELVLVVGFLISALFLLQQALSPPEGTSV